jgi:hypothetical protein
MVRAICLLLLSLRVRFGRISIDLHRLQRTDRVCPLPLRL